jgi:hypothetical protein
MYKHIIFVSALAAFSLSSTAQGLSKDEKKAIKTELKGYQKDPAGFKRMMDKNKETIDSNNAQLELRKATINQLSASITTAQSRVTELEGQLKECQDKPAPKCPDCTVVTTTPTTGVIYKVQMGLFRKFDMNKYLADPKYLTVENAGGMNRYAVSYFKEKEEAQHFADQLIKMGIRGAFVAKYENGERVTERPNRRPSKMK